MTLGEKQEKNLRTTLSFVPNEKQQMPLPDGKGECEAERYELSGDPKDSEEEEFERE